MMKGMNGHVMYLHFFLLLLLCVYLNCEKNVLVVHGQAKCVFTLTCYLVVLFIPTREFVMPHYSYNYNSMCVIILT